MFCSVLFIFFSSLLLIGFGARESPIVDLLLQRSPSAIAQGRLNKRKVKISMPMRHLAHSLKRSTRPFLNALSLRLFWTEGELKNDILSSNFGNGLQEGIVKFEVSVT